MAFDEQSLNQHAAAWGVFQIAFARLETRMAQGIVMLMESARGDFALTITRRMQFKAKVDVLTKLGNELRKAGVDSGRELASAAEAGFEVSCWRNDRIHALVQDTESGVTLIGKNGAPLFITRSECEQKYDVTIAATKAIGTAVMNVIAERNFTEALDKAVA
jgi:hypothetical protein